MPIRRHRNHHGGAWEDSCSARVVVTCGAQTLVRRSCLKEEGGFRMDRTAVQKDRPPTHLLALMNNDSHQRHHQRFLTRITTKFLLDPTNNSIIFLPI